LPPVFHKNPGPGKGKKVFPFLPGPKAQYFGKGFKTFPGNSSQSRFFLGKFLENCPFPPGGFWETRGNWKVNPRNNLVPKEPTQGNQGKQYPN